VNRGGGGGWPVRAACPRRSATCLASLRAWSLTARQLIDRWTSAGHLLTNREPFRARRLPQRLENLAVGQLFTVRRPFTFR